MISTSLPIKWVENHSHLGTLNLSFYGWNIFTIHKILSFSWVNSIRIWLIWFAAPHRNGAEPFSISFLLVLGQPNVPSRLGWSALHFGFGSGVIWLLLSWIQIRRSWSWSNSHQFIYIKHGIYAPIYIFNNPPKRKKKKSGSILTG